MNIYSHHFDVFDDRAAALGEVFAAPAAVAVENAQVLAQTRRLAEQLQAALHRRAVVERAVGILLSRHGGTVEQAREELEARRSGGQQLADVAARIVEDAVRRAQRRLFPEVRRHSG
jgi:hypothetical protein